MSLLDLLKLPEAKGIQDLDAPETTLLHRRIIQSKPFLKNLYLDFYSTFKKYCPEIVGARFIAPSAGAINCAPTVVELGSGGGFLKEIYPNVVTSDILPLPGIDRCFSALEMPFEDSSVDAFLMIDVFHHIPDSGKFLKELDRCLKPGGKAVMIEPANTPWGRFIYSNFHHEAFEPGEGWGLPQTGGPLSCANGALPWIVFVRDRKKFSAEFPELKIRLIEPHTPFRYLVSGGVSMRQLLPSFTYPLVKGGEWILSPFNSFLGMFYTIVVEKT